MNRPAPVKVNWHEEVELSIGIGEMRLQYDMHNLLSELSSARLRSVFRIPKVVKRAFGRKAVSMSIWTGGRDSMNFNTTLVLKLFLVISVMVMFTTRFAGPALHHIDDASNRTLSLVSESFSSADRELSSAMKHVFRVATAVFCDLSQTLVADQHVSTAGIRN